MNILEEEFNELERKILTYEQRFINESDPVKNERLLEIIRADTVTLRYYFQLACQSLAQLAPLPQQYGQSKYSI